MENENNLVKSYSKERQLVELQIKPFGPVLSCLSVQLAPSPLATIDGCVTKWLKCGNIIGILGLDRVIHHQLGAG
jgi:hypothetical protein